MTAPYDVSVYTISDNDILIGDRVGGDHPYVLRVRDMPSIQKPREKLLRYGSSGLSSAELIAVLWGVGTKREELMTMAKRVLHEYGDRAIIHERDATKLAVALDIPETKACQLVACFELGRRGFAVRNGRPHYVRTSQQAYEYIKDMGASKKEQLRGLYLNSQFEVMRDEVISVGSLTANIVHPREVFQPAVEHGAVAVIVAHNHPSGSTEPTADDIEVTRQLLAAGKILAIELIDHLVVTSSGYQSILEASKSDHYQLSSNQTDQVLRHFPALTHMLSDGAGIPHQEIIVRVKSGQYFASLAMTLENLSNDPYIELDTLKYILRKFSDELLYLQDAYKLVKR